MDVRCFACRADGLIPFYEDPAPPVHSCVLVRTRREALDFPRGRLRLDFCPKCGFIQNSLFDPATLDYFQDYEETQAYSPTFNAFAESLARDLIRRYDLRDKEILEIGCGKGEFLALLCGLGHNRGLCVDPSTKPERIPATEGGGISVIRDYYDGRYADLTADFICCRHTLEHVQPVADFVRLSLQAARRRPGAAVFFEVPDSLRVLQEGAFWDIYHEHCSYFTPASLTRLFKQEGARIREVTVAYAGQYLLLEATAEQNGEPAREAGAVGQNDTDETAALVEGFRETARRTATEWRDILRGAHGRGQTVALWGGGSKAVAFMSALELSEEVAYVIDINPHKQGLFLPGSGHQVLGPEELLKQPPDLVVVMNPVYREEIAAELARRGVNAELLTL
ncbi:MAG: class I SAM-dependent methyltransferase [Thermoleophilia bacterium]